MTVKELRQGLRARMFVVPFLTVHVVIIAVLIVEFVVLQTLVRSGAAGSLSEEVVNFIQFGLFWLAVGVVVLGILPMAGVTALQQEMRNGNTELLLLTRLTRWRIVLGKWIMLNIVGGLMFFSILPYILVRYFLGGLDVRQNLMMAAFMLCGNIALNALMIGASGYRNYALRFLVAASGAGAGAASFAAMVGFAYGTNRSTLGWMVLINAATACALFALFGLQLARTRLRLYEYPYEPPPSRLILTLLFCAPVFILMICAMTFWSRGIGNLVGPGLLIWFLLLIDRPPREGTAAPGLQS